MDKRKKKKIPITNKLSPKTLKAKPQKHYKNTRKQAHNKVVKTELSTQTYVHKEKKVNKKHVKCISIITGGRNITKGGSVNHDKTQEEKTFKMKQEITKQKKRNENTRSKHLKTVTHKP